MRASPKTIIRLISFWPPFLACGISVKAYDLDAGWLISRLKTRFWNANAFGTHFGGSLFAMCDPFYIFLTSHRLGKTYYVWDTKTEIAFVKATREPVEARFEVTDEKLAEIVELAKGGDKVLPSFTTVITQPNGEVVAEVRKTIYVRLKPKHRPLEG